MSTVNAAGYDYSWLNSGTTSTEKKDENAQTRFLTLLTTQLKNQDPMNPMENAEMTSQLAQMSTVDGIERLNTMFQQLLAGQESAEAMQAAALVGRGVLVEGDGLVLTEAGGIAGFELPNGADKVTLSIRDSSGIEVAKVDFEDFEAGSHNYVWDGTTLDGSAAAAGLYSVKVTATIGGETVDANALEFGQVTGVIRGPKSTDLQIGNLGIFQFNDIKQIL
ncbi:MAG: flagellar hook assembly protein FlgD [Pseudazoarcus pumilus]|nr:flagellar hook assembly protein FlgD [Pseudazoarcus pumilus]